MSDRVQPPPQTLSTTALCRPGSSRQRGPIEPIHVSVPSPTKSPLPSTEGYLGRRTTNTFLSQLDPIPNSGTLKDSPTTTSPILHHHLSYESAEMRSSLSGIDGQSTRDSASTRHLKAIPTPLAHPPSSPNQHSSANNNPGAGTGSLRPVISGPSHHHPSAQKNPNALTLSPVQATPHA